MEIDIRKVKPGIHLY